MKWHLKFYWSTTTRDIKLSSFCDFYLYNKIFYPNCTYDVYILLINVKLHTSCNIANYPHIDITTNHALRIRMESIFFIELFWYKLYIYIPMFEIMIKYKQTRRYYNIFICIMKLLYITYYYTLSVNIIINIL